MEEWAIAKINFHGQFVGMEMEMENERKSSHGH